MHHLHLGFFYASRIHQGEIPWIHLLVTDFYASLIRLFVTDSSICLRFFYLSQIFLYVSDSFIRDGFFYASRYHHFFFRFFYASRVRLFASDSSVCLGFVYSSRILIFVLDSSAFSESSCVVYVFCLSLYVYKN